MRAVLWGVLLFVLGVTAAGLVAPATRTTPPAPGLSITAGPILGRPGPHQMGVWARTSQPASFRVRSGTAPDRLDLASDAVTPRLEHDSTGWVLLRGLDSDRDRLSR